MKLIPENNISLNGEIELSSDKSLSIRAVLFSAIAHGISKITIRSPGEDSNTALKCIQKLGIQILKTKDSYQIFGLGGFPDNKKKLFTISCDNSGTCLRLISPLIAGSNNSVKITGDKSLSSRPVRIQFLKDFLMNISAKKNNFLPVIIKGNSNAIGTNIKTSVPSAQVVSAAILAGLSSYGLTTIECPNNIRDHTQRLLKFLKYPIQIQNKKNKQIITIQGKQYLNPLKNYNVPSDPSSSAFIIAIAILTKGSKVRIKNVCINNYRIGFISILKRMGAKIKFVNKRNYFNEPIADIIAEYSPNLKGTIIQPKEVPGLIDEVLILAIVAVFCKSQSVFKNLTELKFKESDRLEMLYKNLKLCGANIVRKKDTLIFNGLTDQFYSDKIPTIKTNKDHRVALSFYAFAAATRKKIIIEDFDCIKVSFPNFLEVINQLKTCKHRQIVVAADGTSASGKTSILNKIAKQLGSKVFALDTGKIYRYITKLHLESGHKKINTKYLISKSKNITIQKLKDPKLDSNKISKAVSQVAKIPEIRNSVLPLQRNIVFNSDHKIVLAGGRDLTSFVFNSSFSDLKFFITASVNIRAKRRYEELIKRGEDVKYKDVLDELKKRDFSDKNRKYGKLTKVKDSILVLNNQDGINRPVFEIIKRINLIMKERKNI